MKVCTIIVGLVILIGCYRNKFAEHIACLAARLDVAIASAGVQVSITIGLVSRISLYNFYAIEDNILVEARIPVFPGVFGIITRFGIRSRNVCDGQAVFHTVVV